MPSFRIEMRDRSPQSRPAGMACRWPTRAYEVMPGAVSSDPGSRRSGAGRGAAAWQCQGTDDIIRASGWLGHRSPETTHHYAQITPNTLTKAYTDAGYFSRNVRTIEVLIDWEAVLNGAAAAGKPWQHDDAAFRRRILTQLNHTELRHRLGRRIHHGERGEIRSPLQQGQEEQLGALGLALNAVVHWNAIYMQEAIRHVSQEGMDVSNDDIAHLSPLIWRHLNFLGRYDFSLPDTVMNGGLRPLRNPISAWDF